MVSQEKSTQTNPSLLVLTELFGFKLKYFLKFVSSLLVPLALGVCTVVITVNYQNAVKRQHEEDRNASQLQRELEKNLSHERYHNNLFDVYIKDIGRVLDKYKGSITVNDATAPTVRVKTLNVFRQLDSQHNVRIIRFLHEAKQLTETDGRRPLDLSTTKLFHIDFRDVAVNEKQLDGLSLTNIFLSNATFIKIEMKKVNFADVRFDDSNFSFAKISDSNFASSSLSNSNCSSVLLSRTNLESARLEKTNFSSAVLFNSHFSSARLDNVNFSNALLNDVRFSFASINNVDFSNATLVNVRFDSATLRNVKFLHSKLHKVSFEYADLGHVNFSHAILGNLYYSFPIFLMKPI
jgi:uncharacterized protein YjbI with pentapeptide repeats